MASVAMSMRFSFIVPCLNEEEGIVACLEALPFRNDAVEIIVVDGGSSDKTLSLVEDFFHRHLLPLENIVSSEKGRARQMNAGAQAASGEVLVFVHADSLLPEASHESLSAFAGNEQYVWGFFLLQLDNDAPVFRLIAFLINRRSRLSQVATGDQCLFIRRDTFRQLGGFPDIPLMEDVAMSKLLKNHGKAFIVRQHLTSSSRRWLEHGVVKTILLMWYLRLLFFLGVPATYLHGKYYRPVKQEKK